MTRKNDPAKSDQRKKPAEQTDESEGTIKDAQLTDQNMKRKDLPRGSQREPYVRD
jgi:hypothetical protein